MPLTQPQTTVINSGARFRVLVTGRRFGKTYLAINEIAKFASQPNKKDQKAVDHFLYGFKSIDENYSVGDWLCSLKGVLKKIRHLIAKVNLR